MGYFDVESSNWGLLLTITFIVAVIIAAVFTTTLGGLAFAAIVVGLFLAVLYYIGVRIDRRLRHGPRRTEPTGAAGEGGDSGTMDGEGGDQDDGA